MKKALILAPMVAALVACGGDRDDATLDGDTLGVGTTMPPPATFPHDTMMGAPGMGMPGDTMMMDTGMVDTMGMGTTRP
jgi:hypothetical protein